MNLQASQVLVSDLPYYPVAVERTVPSVGWWRPRLAATNRSGDRQWAAKRALHLL